MNLSKEQKLFISNIKNSKRFAVTRFELRSSTEPDLISTALNYVHLENPNESMETVKKRSALIEKMYHDGLINVCYHLPLSARSDFQVYLDSDVYHQLCQLVEDGKQKPDFLFDTAYLKRGVITVTEKGRQAFLAENSDSTN